MCLTASSLLSKVDKLVQIIIIYEKEILFIICSVVEMLETERFPVKHFRSEINQLRNVKILENFLRAVVSAAAHVKTGQGTVH